MIYVMQRTVWLIGLWFVVASAFAQNQPPTISMWLPTNGFTYEAPATVQLRVSASDPDGTVVKVVYNVSGTLNGTLTSTTAPFGLNWGSVPAGTYTISATATDNQNATTTSSARTITVFTADGSNPAPAITQTSPINGAVYATATQGGVALVTMWSNATDSNGTVNRVEYYVNGILQCVALGSPWYCPLNVPAGTWGFQAKAFDNQGKATTTSTNTVTVLAPDPNNAAPTISLTSPINNATYYSPATLLLRAAAADSDGTVNRVEYYVNGSYFIGQSTAAPYYGFNWINALGAGTYTITAKVYDNKGKSTTSSAATVVVSDPVGGNPAPAVSLSLPVNNSTYEAPATVLVQAAASDNGSVNRVEIFANGAFQTALAASPYAVSLSAVAAGTYAWTAVAYDNQGASTTSAAVNTVVNTPNPNNAAPAVTLTSPANNTVLAAPASMTLSATASDADGSINRVEFYVNNALLVTVTAAPYNATWSNVPAGSYSITAKAWDNLGKATTTAAVNVTVVNDTAPTVSITQPSNNANFHTGSNVLVSATANDPDGSIAKVEFFAGTTLIGTVTSAPYTITWSNVQTGAYTLTAKATDNQGLPTTSSPITVTVSAAAATIFYIYADHLNTPRAITSEAATKIWSWDNVDPFGANAPNEDPDGDTNLFTFNLRFPGQYFDKETNTHYNYYRDYDPAIGRYVQSDPVGVLGLATIEGNIPGFEDFAASWFSTRPLPGATAALIAAGIPEVVMEWPSVASAGLLPASFNLYAYVDGSPLRVVDPLGLGPKDPWYGFNEPAFRDYVHQIKQKEGLPGNYQYSRAQMEIMRCDWESEGKPGGKGNKSGKGGQKRGWQRWVPRGGRGDD